MGDRQTPGCLASDRHRACLGLAGWPQHRAALFTDVDSRRVEVRVDDRDGRPRRRGGLLAPASAAIEKPTSLFLVWLPQFDLVRTGGREPVLRIADVDLTVG